MNDQRSEINYRILKRIEDNPGISQRKLSKELGVSVGKINYCIRALVDKGLLKINNFKENPSKLAYTYILTPKGIEEKARITVKFLQRKLKEYDLLKTEIAELQKETRQIGTVKHD